MLAVCPDNWNKYKCNTILIGNPLCQPLNKLPYKYSQSECIQKVAADASTTIHSAF